MQSCRAGHSTIQPVSQYTRSRKTQRSPPRASVLLGLVMAIAESRKHLLMNKPQCQVAFRLSRASFRLRHVLLVRPLQAQLSISGAKGHGLDNSPSTSSHARFFLAQFFGHPAGPAAYHSVPSQRGWEALPRKRRSLHPQIPPHRTGGYRR